MRFLIIDDESLLRRSLSRALIIKGHEVFTASDGLSGLKLWKETLPDIVFLDVIMPGLSGPQVLKNLHIRENNEIKSKVIMMSAYSGDLVPSVNIEGVDLILAKPFHNIFETIERAEKLVS